MAEQYSRWGRTRETYIELDDSRGEGMGMKVPEDETQDATGFTTN